MTEDELGEEGANEIFQDLKCQGQAHWATDENETPSIR